MAKRYSAVDDYTEASEVKSSGNLKSFVTSYASEKCTTVPEYHRPIKPRKKTK